MLRQLLSTLVVGAGIAASATGAAAHNHWNRATCGTGPFAGSYIGLTAGLGGLNSEPAATHIGQKYESDDTAFVGGIVSGYNWQCDRFVFGIESDSNFFDADAVKHVSGDRLGTDIDYYGTLRGRIGVTVGESLLVYGTGGLAYASVENTYHSGTYSWTYKDDDFKFGWVAGGGVEWLRSANWAARVEALYVDLESSNASVTVGNGCSTSCSGRFEWDDSFWVVRAGLSYKFGAPAPVYRPLK